MDVPLSVDELVRILGDTYQTIDVRCAAVRQGQTWVNSLAVIRLTYEEPARAEDRLRRLPLSSVQTEGFRIAVEARPFCRWSQLCDEIANGLLRINGLTAKMREPVSLLKQSSYLRPDSGGLRPFDGVRWPELQICSGPHVGTEMANEQLVRQLGSLGFSDAYEAVNSCCEVNVSRGQSHGYDLYLSVPLFATVAALRKLPGENRLQVELKRHVKLSAVNATVMLRGRDFRTGPPAKAWRQVPGFARIGEESPIESLAGTVELPESDDDDSVEVRLVHPDLGVVDTQWHQLRALVPPPERNALLEAFRKFCPDADPERVLTRPHETKSRKLRESAVFELRVTWLLGLFGFCTILLADYELLRVPGTKVQRGSADILAASPDGKTLLIVACTLGTPKDEDFGNLLNVREILLREVFAGTDVSVLPVLFTGAAGCPTYREIESGHLYVPILDIDGVAALLGLLRTGREERFLEFLSNPAFCPLPPRP